MSEVFGSRRFWRRAGERVAEHTARIDEGMKQLHDDGIAAEAIKPILGWCYLQMLVLTPERAIAALTQDKFVLAEEGPHQPLRGPTPERCDGEERRHRHRARRQGRARRPGSWASSPRARARLARPTSRSRPKGRRAADSETSP